MRRLKGQKFGRLTVIARGERPEGVKNRQAYWLCECECGGTKVAMASHLLSGATQSCGCLQKESVTIHGWSVHPLYNTWAAMIARCHNPADPHYAQYGARGIRVCDEWRRDFKRFVKDIGEKPHVTLTVDRKDNDGNYTKGNTRWSSRLEQADNTQQIFEFYAKPPTAEPAFITHNMAAFRRKYKVPIKYVPESGTVTEVNGWQFWRCVPTKSEVRFI